MQAQLVKKLLLSGGHITPALALIDYVTEQHPEIELVFVGREYSQDLVKQESVERLEVEQRRKIPFISLQAVRWSWGSLLELCNRVVRFAATISDALRILRKEKPSAVVSFGGYVALPLAIAAKWLSIPIITHEQTRTVGLSTQLISFLATGVAVSHVSSMQHLPKKKTLYTGNPIRKQMLADKQSQPQWFPAGNEKPVLLVLGGNQGSLVLNTLVLQMLAELTKDWCIVHQCGKPTAVHNYLSEMELAKSNLPAKQQKCYQVREWLSEQELSWLMRRAQLAISRSGANTVMELAIAKLPSILVPLLNSRNNEAELNARWLADAGGALKLDQSDLTQENLQRAITQVDSHREQMRQSLQNLPLELNGAAKLFSLIQACVVVYGEQS